MLYILIGVFALIYGVWYAINPLPPLQRKFGNDEVPKQSILAARISGVVIAVIGVVCIVVSVMRELG